jgi:hypothetical protein
MILRLLCIWLVFYSLLSYVIRFGPSGPVTCASLCVVTTDACSPNYMIDYHRNSYRRTKTCKWRLGSMVTCDVESKWYSRKHSVVVYWMSVLLCIHNECRTKLSTSAKFALKGTVLNEIFDTSVAFFIITARNYEEYNINIYRILDYCRNVRLCKTVRFKGCE